MVWREGLGGCCYSISSLSWRANVDSNFLGSDRSRENFNARISLLCNAGENHGSRLVSILSTHFGIGVDVPGDAAGLVARVESCHVGCPFRTSPSAPFPLRCQIRWNQDSGPLIAYQRPHPSSTTADISPYIHACGFFFFLSVDDIICTMTRTRTGLHITSKTGTTCYSCIDATATHTHSHTHTGKHISILGWDYEVSHMGINVFRTLHLPLTTARRDIEHLLHTCEPLTALMASVNSIHVEIYIKRSLGPLSSVVSPQQRANPTANRRKSKCDE